MLDAHQRPPESVRAAFKFALKTSMKALEQSDHLLDLASSSGGGRVREHRISDWTNSNHLEIFKDFLSIAGHSEGWECLSTPVDEVKSFELTALPGLFIIPSLLPPAVQIELLGKLLHRDLSNPAHKTNLHLHYDLVHGLEPNFDHIVNTSHPQSFFQASADLKLLPKDPTIHRPLTMKQVLEKKLRWVTLGGQYDWTAKKYPSEEPPAFPEDIGDMLHRLFPDIYPQAAIVNFYSPGDTLSAHRDVSEECDRSLISISIGCDGIFLVANEEGSQIVTLRLRSGDAVLMTGKSRYAWHAVPKIVSNTCPTWLSEWPATVEAKSEYDSWRGWMKSKRINLNVRQINELKP